mgnify:CR=1 FL=1
MVGVDGARGGVRHGDDAGVVGLIAVRDAGVDLAVGADGVFAGTVDVAGIGDQFVDADRRSRVFREAAGVGAVEVEHGGFGDEVGRADGRGILMEHIGHLAGIGGDVGVQHFIFGSRRRSDGIVRESEDARQSEDCEDDFHLFLICRFCSIFGAKRNLPFLYLK